MNRIISIDDEKQNEDICDYVFEYRGAEETAKAIIDTLRLDRTND
jgi:hypothetical protein